MEVIKLNLIPAGALPVVHASQYDDGRDFKAELYEGVNVYTLDGTETLTAIVKKPDGNEVTAAVTNTSDNYVIITTTEQMTACAGGNLGTLRIEKGAVTIATLNFILECQASPDTGIQSDSEIHNFEAQVNQMVEDALASQYDSANVIFDNLPTAGHGIPYTVTSEGIGNAIDNALDMTDTASGAIATFESEYALPLRDLEIEINAVETGDGNPKSPSNPYIISGFTGSNIKQFGDNLISGDTYQLGANVVLLGESAEDTYSTYLKATTYTISFTRPTSKTFRLDLTDSNGVQTRLIDAGTATSRTFTIATEGFYKFGTYLIRGMTSADIANVMLVAGSYVKPYKAYTAPTTTPISWQSEAGTVYGGSLDVTSGVLTVTYGSIADIGQLTWESAGNYKRAMIPDAKAGLIGIKSDKYTCLAIRDQLTTNDQLSPYNASSKHLTCLDTPTSGFLIYQLETPITYQLTPTQISAIVGTNNVFTDTNGDTSLEYYAGHGADTAQVAEEIVADYAAKVVKTKNGIFANLLKSPLNSVWLICCQKVTTAGSGFVGIYSFDGVNLSPCVVHIDGMSASFDSATGTITVKYGGSTTDVYGSAFRLA